MKIKLMILPKEATWWIWLVNALLLGAGIFGSSGFFLAAIGLTAAQARYLIETEQSFTSYPVQIRLAFLAGLSLLFFLGVRWLFWLPLLGTVVLLLFGYCLLARTLSLAPWNRREALTLELLRRTYLAPPMNGPANSERLDRPVASSRCAGEAAAASMSR